MIGGDEMTLCKNCGAEVDEKSQFCGNCGANIETPLEKEAEDINNKKSFPIRISRNVIIAIAVLLVVILGAIIPVRNYIIRKDPVNRAIYGINKLYKANTVHTTSTLKLQMTAVPEDAQAKAVAKIIEGFSIKVDSKSSNKSGEASLLAQLIYKDQPFLKANVFLNKEGVVISAPDIYNKTMFVKWDEINNLANEGKNNGQIDIEKYKKLLDLKTSKVFGVVSKDYSEFFRTSFKTSFITGDKIKLEVVDGGTSKFITTGTVNFTTDSAALIDILDKFIEKAAKDSNVKTLIKDKMLELFQLIEKNNDYDKLDLTKDEVETIKKDFDKEYEKAMNQILAEKNFTQAKKALNLNIKSNLRFDSSNNYRGALTEINASVNEGETVGIKLILDQVVNSLDSKVTVDKMELSGVDLNKISPEEEEDMNMQLQQGLLKILDQLGLAPLLMGL